MNHEPWSAEQANAEIDSRRALLMGLGGLAAGAVLAPLAGTAGVVVVWLWQRSVVGATLAGAVAYAAGVALAG